MESNLEVAVFPRYRQVRLRGPYTTVKSHQESIKPYVEDFNLLVGITTFGDMDRTGKYSVMFSFGDDAGLERYLEFNEWHHLLGK